jgi:hypothetical protein
MDMFFFKIVVLWIAVDTFLIATGWFLATTVRPLCPGWWQRVIADEAPPLAKF